MLAFLLEGGIAGLIFGIAAFLFGAWAIDYVSLRRHRWGLESRVPPHPGVVVIREGNEGSSSDPLEGGGSSVKNDGTF